MSQRASGRAVIVRVLTIREQQLGRARPHAQIIRKDYAFFLRTMGRDEEAPLCRLVVECHKPNLATEGLHILAMTLTDAVSPIGKRVNSLPHCSVLAKPSSNAVEPTPRLLQLGRGGRLIFQHDLLLEEVAEALRFGCNPLTDRGGG